ncbi:nitroreductase family protein [Trinickia sp. Y13]|jgi:nitroreductase|uniref:nitroreductase family protein n=1 Tax=Trinickia sp. Y13 TaxID=2917807 RepID=UPI002405AEC8|nr:nitroreductase family protein [Trinickia sp. Y13]MDG0027210.1 nitroreductase family protein [Trinickia sp. Y13]
MKIDAMLALIERRVSANRFDATHVLPDTVIGELVRLATRAPTAYHLQNWRFVAVKTPEAKATLRALAYDQAKVSDAAVTFIVCGQLPDALRIHERLSPFVESGHMTAETSSSWQDGARAQYANPRDARDEAVRSASLGAATLIYAAEAMGFVSGAMGGFDAEGVARAFALGADEVPVMLVCVGRAAPGNWPQKPRRPLSEVLVIA